MKGIKGKQNNGQNNFQGLALQTLKQKSYFLTN
jgi:hypothetical protein